MTASARGVCRGPWPLLLLGLVCGAARPTRGLRDGAHGHIGGGDREGHEVSGVARDGDDVLFVEDSVPGTVFHATIVEAWGETALEDVTARRDPLAGAALAGDLESVVLLNGDVLVLSEDLHQVLDRNGTRYTYASRFGEIGNRGLEGLAVRTGDRGALRAAALFEGGYLSPGNLPEDLRPTLRGVALLPEVILHVLPPPGSVARQRKNSDAKTFLLQVDEIQAGPPVPEGERFRGTDLVWHERADGSFELIVLLSSASPPGEGERTFTHAWLQRFDLEGHPSGAPLDVRAWLRANRLGEIAGANWEGLCWWEPGRTVCLVNDAGGKGRTSFLFLPIPEDWSD